MSLTGDELICPYCGHEKMDSWEALSDDGTWEKIECSGCGKEYYGSMSVSVDYNTKTTESFSRYGNHSTPSR